MACLTRLLLIKTNLPNHTVPLNPIGITIQTRKPDRTALPTCVEAMWASQRLGTGASSAARTKTASSRVAHSDLRGPWTSTALLRLLQIRIVSYEMLTGLNFALSATIVSGHCIGNTKGNLCSQNGVCNRYCCTEETRNPCLTPLCPADVDSTTPVDDSIFARNRQVIDNQCSYWRTKGVSSWARGTLTLQEWNRL